MDGIMRKCVQLVEIDQLINEAHYGIIFYQQIEQLKRYQVKDFGGPLC